VAPHRHWGATCYRPTRLCESEARGWSVADVSGCEPRAGSTRLVVAHQYLAQLGEGARDAILGSAGTIVCSCAGATDAEFLGQELRPELSALDLVRLPNYSGYVRLMVEGAGASPFRGETLRPGTRTWNACTRALKWTRITVLITLDGFDFAAQPTLDRDAIFDLARGDFVRERRNVVLVGGVGTGKTHLAIALGLACCQKELRVRFTSAAELTNLLVEAKAEGRLSRKLEQLARYDLVLLDELGYVPFDRHGADLLFGFVTKVYERRSLVVTTNPPFARWSEVFLDATAAAAVIDRIVHHATVLKTDGDSYRLKAARQGGRKRKEVEPT